MKAYSFRLDEELISQLRLRVRGGESVSGLVRRVLFEHLDCPGPAAAAAYERIAMQGAGNVPHGKYDATRNSGIDRS